MNIEDVDTLLHQHAQRWTQQQPEPPPVQAAIATPPSHSPWSNRFLVAAACLIVVIVAAAIVPSLRFASTSHRRAGSTTASTLNRATTLPPAVQERLTKIARQQVSDNLATPVTAQAVRTTFHRAEVAVLDGETDSGPPDAPVWVLQIQGDFVCGCPVPPRMPSPRGHVYTFILAADTYRVEAYSLGDRTHYLTRLGAVIDLIK